MEIKKNDSKNLEKKRGLFFQLGLLITGSLTLAAFTFQLPETRVDLNEKLAFRPTTLEFDLEPQEIQKKSEDASTEELATSSTVDSEQAASELIRQTGNLQQTVESGTDVNLGDLLSGLKTTIGTDLIKIELEDKIEEYPLPRCSSTIKTSIR